MLAPKSLTDDLEVLDAVEQLGKTAPDDLVVIEHDIRMTVDAPNYSG